MDKRSELATADDNAAISNITELRKPVLGSARDTFVFNDGWDNPLTDVEMQDLFGL